MVVEPKQYPRPPILWTTVVPSCSTLFYNNSTNAEQYEQALILQNLLASFRTLYLSISPSLFLSFSLSLSLSLSSSLTYEQLTAVEGSKADMRCCKPLSVSPPYG